MEDNQKEKSAAKKKLERLVSKSNERDWSVHADGIPRDVIQNAINNADKDRVTRKWKQPKSITRSVRLWEKSFGVIDLREMNLVSQWTAYQNIMECLPPDRIMSYYSFRKVLNHIMIPLGHAYAVRHVELSRMDMMSMSPEILARSTFYVVNAQCLPLYVWYMYRRSADGKWVRTPHNVEEFMKHLTSATPEDLDNVFSVRYDHMWLSRFPRGYTSHAWVWNGRVWDGAEKPRDVTLVTVRPYMEGVRYEENFIRERHKYLDDAFDEEGYGEYDEQ